MHFTGGRGRQRSWWLFVGLLACVLLFTVTSAAPAGASAGTGTDEIQPASDAEGEGGLRNRRTRIFRSEGGGTIDTFDHQKPSDVQTIPHQISPVMDPRGGFRPIAPVEPFTWSKASVAMSRVRQSTAHGYTKLQTLGANGIDAVKRYTRAKALQSAKAAEARRLRKLGPQPGDVEVPGVHKLSKDERDTRFAQAWQANAPVRQELELSEIVPARAQQPEAAGRAVLSPERLKAAVLSTHPVQPPASSSRREAASSLAEVSEGRPLSEGWRMYWNTDRSGVLFARYQPHTDRPVHPQYFEELSNANQEEVLKLIPVVEELRQNGWDVTKSSRRPAIGTSGMDGSGVYTFSNRLQQDVNVRSRKGRIEFGYLAKSGGTRKWKPFQDIPDHLKAFLRWEKHRGAAAPGWFQDISHVVMKRSVSSSDLRKRAGGSSSSKPVDSLQYQGEGWIVHQQPEAGVTVFTPYDPHNSDHAFMSQPFSRWGAAQQESIMNIIRPLRSIHMEVGIPDNLWRYKQHGLFIGDSMADHTGLYKSEDRFPQEIHVRSRRVGVLRQKIYEFEHATLRKGRRRWSEFKGLPEHLQNFLRKEAQTRYPKWVNAIPRNLRKRSITSSHLRKRAGGSSSRPDTIVGTLDYKGEGWRRYAMQDGSDVLYTPYTPHSAQRATTALPFDQWSAENQERILSLFPQAQALQRNRVEINTLAGYGVLGSPNDYSSGANTYRDHFPQTIRVRSRKASLPRFGTIYEFEHAARRNGQREWTEFKGLPAHLQELVRSDAAINHPAWFKAVKFRKRSLSPSYPDGRSIPVDASSGAANFDADQAEARKLQRLKKRADPQHVAWSSYLGETFKITQTGGVYQFHFLRSDGQTLYRSSPWSGVHRDIKTLLTARFPGMRDMAKSSMSIQEARQQGFRIADGVYDGTNVYENPQRPRENVQILRSQRGIQFVRNGGNGIGVSFHQLPSYLQEHLQSDPAIADVVREASSVARRRFRKRGLDLQKRDGSDYPAIVHYPGEKMMVQREGAGKVQTSFSRVLATVERQARRGLRKRALADGADRDHRVVIRAGPSSTSAPPRSDWLSISYPGRWTHLTKHDGVVYVNYMDFGDRTPFTRSYAGLSEETKAKLQAELEARKDTATPIRFAPPDAKYEVYQFSDPERRPETIYFLPTNGEIWFQRHNGYRMLAPAKYEQLPGHLQYFLNKMQNHNQSQIGQMIRQAQADAAAAGHMV